MRSCLPHDPHQDAEAAILPILQRGRSFTTNEELGNHKKRLRKEATAPRSQNHSAEQVEWDHLEADRERSGSSVSLAVDYFILKIAADPDPGTGLL
jgi:hypothetical protein